MNYYFNIDKDKSYVEILGDKPECGVLNNFFNSIFISNDIELIYKIRDILSGNIPNYEMIYNIKYISVNKESVMINLDAYSSEGVTTYKTDEFLKILEDYVNEYCKMMEVDESYYKIK